MQVEAAELRLEEGVGHRRAQRRLGLLAPALLDLGEDQDAEREAVVDAPVGGVGERAVRLPFGVGSASGVQRVDRLEAVQDDSEAQFLIGVEYATEQCRELVRAGVPGIHFYALNKSPACERILDALSLPQ